VATTPRIDSELEDLLADLMADGGDRSTVIREAVRLAWRERRRRELAAEMEAITSDAQALAEIRAAMRDVEQLRAW
jgi:Arc/MetJ-type ribon-helix-helix transcriptional regulator